MNDLEYHEYTKLFRSDFRDRYVNHVLKQGGKIVEDQAWSFEGHPGWRIFEEHQGTRVEIRVFVVRYRFYGVSVAIKANQQVVDDRQQKILASFHLLSQHEWTAERERLIELSAPAPLSHESFVKRLQSDSEEENSRGNVKRVYIEEAQYFGKPQPSASHPVTRKDFDRNGYLLSKVEYADNLPLEGGTQKANEENYAYAYEFDSYQNWTKRITYLVTKTGDSTKRVPIKVTYRTITYY